jgi:hypothetical protein
VTLLPRGLIRCCPVLVLRELSQVPPPWQPTKAVLRNNTSTEAHYPLGRYSQVRSPQPCVTAIGGSPANG